MNFTKIEDVNNQISCYLTPGQLINLDYVSKSIKSSPSQWQIKGYKDIDDFKIIFHELFSSAEDKKLIKEYLLNGSINSFQAKEILLQNLDNKNCCLSFFGIKTIASKIFTPFEITMMDREERELHLSKGGFEIIQKVKTFKPLKLHKNSMKPYELLGLQMNCSVDDMNKTFRVIQLALHPDKNKGNENEANKLFAIFLNIKCEIIVFHDKITQSL